MDYSARTIERLSLTASILGLIQGSLWFLGGLFSIIIYYNVFELNVDDGSIPYYIFRIITSEYDRTIIIFMFTYAVLSITLSVFSALLIKETFLTKSDTRLGVYVSWSFNIVILSLVDIVLACFLGRDLSDLFYQTGTPPVNLLDAYTIILLVSMRGILLWIINIVLAGYITVFGFQLSRAANSRPNDVIHAFEELNGPWHTNLSNNPLARLSRKENGKTTTNSYQNLIGAENFAENFTINSEIFRKQENYEERLANIGKPGRRTPLKSPSPVNVPPPIPPPIPDDGNLNDSTHATETFSNADMNGDEKISHEIENIFGTISMENKKLNNNPDYPYIPSPDYSPVGSPVLKAKSEEHADRNAGTKITLF